MSTTLHQADSSPFPSSSFSPCTSRTSPTLIHYRGMQVANFKRLIPIVSVLFSTMLILICCMQGGYDSSTSSSLFSPPLCFVSAAVETSASTLPPFELRCLSTPTSSFLLRRVIAQYRLMRPNANIEMTEIDNTATLSGSAILLKAMENGEADFAISSLVPTDAQKAASPDLLHFPFAAFPFGPIYNLPTLQVPLILSIQALAKIYAGNITRSDNQREKEGRGRRREKFEK